ncbi:MAG: phosphoribosylanthranilate isomerase [Firmicutes bacterium]|nr:phosphoribosylanthranilate isomerase [Bacillota bacterium]
MKLKICGLQTIQDIEYVNQADIDYAGFVFAPSRQYITVKTAQTLKKALNPKIKVVGVFVNELPDFIKNLVADKIIDLVQFHGNTEFALPCPTIRAYRMRTKADITPTKCDFALFDSYTTGTDGSTGKTFDWRLIADYKDKPFFLAGGINIDNLQAAMTYNPYCIDISSGAEQNGIKSKSKILEIAKAVKEFNL